ncbi:hypothetical protein ACFPZK_00715 [Psychrobacter urativorans]|uniref:COG4705 family protein n=1 Tax=Psychrobacter urativorans TaxID=45610 RepID=UPI002234DAD7|nr:hypothetical protein [Psychrobacter urativorans]
MNTQSLVSSHTPVPVGSCAHSMWNKVPQIIFIFWLIKMMSTTVGETAADYLNFNYKLGLPLTSLIMAVMFLIALRVQLRADRYIPWKYWLTVVFVSILGTLITDNMTDNMGIPLAVSTIGFSIILAMVFALWYARERTLSIHHIDSLAREWYYWVAILATFALGTAAGDWFAEGLQLGYQTSTLIFAAAIALIAIAFYALKLNSVLCFWLAYILTRPLGAALGDWLSQPVKNGGLGLGVTSISLLFLAMIIVLVGLESYRAHQSQLER